MVHYLSDKHFHLNHLIINLKVRTNFENSFSGELINYMMMLLFSYNVNQQANRTKSYI